MKGSHLNSKGFTLIEVILAMLLFSIIAITFIPISVSHLSFYNKLDDTLFIQQNTKFVLNYIEKRIRECDRQSTLYISQDKTIESKDFSGEEVWVDLSGKKRNNKNTLLYFYRSTGELRVNKNGEHNVLYTQIKDIEVTEVVEGELLQIKVIADKIDYSVTTTIKLNYR
ncbi:prepilin-type N-terminal cleavage/methylation domain-containing protein [Anaerovirgula multivorans]|uniref:Prepilin-type N-terminal cleavage/methylation domain-containing protein n=1 Tax=Anaerovirgula multivorans TaxID=312168 RepID=A0A238ZTB9_9FIRM|nr:prepilin-type N-terminal cleavage/methylation domain-containing protein [Anaerovirgula multivorans]SNR86600.1 prepilin-type N-terminal cleavage/methylation domain-containing protein [Anaerovirgula multivorans]